MVLVWFGLGWRVVIENTSARNVHIMICTNRSRECLTRSFANVLVPLPLSILLYHSVSYSIRLIFLVWFCLAHLMQAILFHRAICFVFWRLRMVDTLGPSVAHQFEPPPERDPPPLSAVFHPINLCIISVACSTQILLFHYVAYSISLTSF